MKRCFRCGVDKPEEEFYAHPKMKDGRLGKCKECACEDVRRNRRLKAEQYSAYERARQQRPKRRAAKVIYLRWHNRRNPEKHQARLAVARALRSGVLVRLPCEVCGGGAVQAHHQDYARPLAVRWLCFRCHRERAHGQHVVAF